MRKERDRIVAWLLTFVLIFIMAVGSGRVIFAEAEFGEVDEAADGSEEAEPEETETEETEPEESAIPLDVTVTVKDKQYDGTTHGELEEITVSVAEEVGAPLPHDITSLTENLLSTIWMWSSGEMSSWMRRRLWYT